MCDKLIQEILKNNPAYIVCSTLNQIVNFIPLKIIDELDKDKYKDIKIDVYSITFDTNSENDSKFKRFNNSQWDDNLKKSLENLNIVNYKSEIKIDSNKVSNINDISTAIKNRIYGDKLEINSGINNNTITNNSIIWNITGGQRNTVFAIQKLLIDEKRKDDYLIYLEGNSNKIFYLKLKEHGEGFEEGILEQSYNVNLDINTVFGLAGFKIRDGENKINFLCPKSEDNANLKLSKKLFEFYKNENVMDKGVRQSLLSLNKNGNIDDKLNQFWKNVNSCYKGKFEKEDKNALDKLGGNSNFKFGYVLEYMSIYAIIKYINEDKSLKDYFVGLYHSLNLIRNDEIDTKTNINELCEFDMVLLTKSGQVVIFECKSGTMSSDVGKARMYTAYAAGGVYGKPILITPLLKEEKNNIYEIYFKENSKSDDKFENKFDEAILSAFRAAARANLDVWTIDEIDTKLKQLFNKSL